MTLPNIRILLADDHRMIRSGLKGLLEREPGWQVVAEADHGRAAVALAEEHAPDAAVIDVSMPDMNGIDATRQIVARCPGTRVVALSAHGDVRFTSEMLRAGAIGYVSKDAAFEELVTAIRSALAGTSFISPSIAAESLHPEITNGNGHRVKSVFDLLSPREREVLQLMAEGLATKEIANHLHVSVKTVETHRRSMMEKLSLDSVALLTKYAVREGITSLG